MVHLLSVPGLRLWSLLTCWYRTRQSLLFALHTTNCCYKEHRYILDYWAISTVDFITQSDCTWLFVCVVHQQPTVVDCTNVPPADDAFRLCLRLWGKSRFRFLVGVHIRGKINFCQSFLNCILRIRSPRWWSVSIQWTKSNHSQFSLKWE